MGSDAIIRPGFLNSGSALRKVDALLNETNDAGEYQRRESFRSALERIGSFEEDHAEEYLDLLKSDPFMVEGRALIDDTEESILRQWFTTNPPDGAALWPELLPLEPIMRRGTIDTIELAQERNLPIVSYWVRGGANFEVLRGDSSHQVTRVIITPPPSRQNGGMSSANVSVSVDIAIASQGPSQSRLSTSLKFNSE